MLEGFLNILLIGGLPLLFLLVLIEGNPFIGSFVPGQVLTILVGFMIATTNSFNLYITICVVFFGALFGDIIGYYIGKKYGYNGLKIFKLDKKSMIYKSSENFFKKFGVFSIILGREFNLTRAFMPFFAGIFKMDTKKFIFLAIISNLIWSLLSILLGFYFGIIVIDKLNLFFYFLVFLLIYSIIIRIIYRSFIEFNKKNDILHIYYGLRNIFGMFVLLISLILFLFYGKWGYKTLFNEQFVILFMPSLYYVGGVLLSKFFLFFLIWLLLMFLIYKKDFQMIILLIWSNIITLFIFYVFNLFIVRVFDFYINSFIIFLVIFIFYLHILIKKYIPKYNLKIDLDILIFLFLFFSIISLYSYMEDLFLIIISFLISAIICEILILLSHYQILDKSLADLLNNFK